MALFTELNGRMLEDFVHIWLSLSPEGAGRKTLRFRAQTSLTPESSGLGLEGAMDTFLYAAARLSGHASRLTESTVSIILF